VILPGKGHSFGLGYRLPEKVTALRECRQSFEDDGGDEAFKRWALRPARLLANTNMVSTNKEEARYGPNASVCGTPRFDFWCGYYYYPYCRCWDHGWLRLRRAGTYGWPRFR
jgi:hypothetical protein